MQLDDHSGAPDLAPPAADPRAERDAPARHPVIIECMRDLALASPDDRLRVFAECAVTLAGFASSGLMKRPDATDALIEMAQQA
jgi:hypothetical protein